MKRFRLSSTNRSHRRVRIPARRTPLQPSLELLESRYCPAVSLLAIGADAGAEPRVNLYEPSTGAVVRDFLAFDAGFSGGVRVAVGDVNADGAHDVAAAAGPGGGPHVKVFDGKTGELLHDFFAFNAGFSGGVNVALGDVNGDGRADIAAAAGAGGGPHVRIFDGVTGAELHSFFAYDARFMGGVNIALGDVNGDANADIVTGAGAGGGPHVRVFNGTSGDVLRSFFAYDELFTGGVNVSAADLNTDGHADLITGAGAGGGPHVRLLDGATDAVLADFFAYDASFTGGVRVGATSIDSAGLASIVTAAEIGIANVRLFNGPGGVPSTELSVFNKFADGAFVAQAGLPVGLTELAGGTLGNFFQELLEPSNVLVTLELDPLNVDLLGLQIQTSPITVTVSVEQGSGQLLGNLLSVVSNLVNLEGVNNALNNVLDNVVSLVNAASLVLDVAVGDGPLSSAPESTTPILDLFVAPIQANLLGAVVTTSPITVNIRANAGDGLVLGNVLSELAHLFDPPLPDQLDLNFINGRLAELLADLEAQIPGLPSAPVDPVVIESNSEVLRLVVPPIDLDLLGLNLRTDQIRVNADAQVGSGELLGNVLTTLLNTLNATPEEREELSNNLNALLAKVVGILNSVHLVLPDGALEGLSEVLQTLALPDLVTAEVPATAPVLNVEIAAPSGQPVDVDLLGLRITTSNIHLQLDATTGEGQILGNLVYNVAHLLDPGGSLNLLTILNALAL